MTETVTPRRRNHALFDFAAFEDPENRSLFEFVDDSSTSTTFEREDWEVRC